LDNEFVVLLLRGKNSFGDKIFSYVKIHLPNLPRLKSAIVSGGGFNPSDFGEVVAAGRGEPTEEIKAELAATYKVFEGQTSGGVTSNPTPTPQKSWDEY